MALADKSDRTFGLYYLKSGCLLFWACWFFLAFITNLSDALYTMGNLPSQWHFRSGNYALLDNTLAIYHTPAWILNSLFTCDVLIQGLSGLLFFMAFMKFDGNKNGWRLVNIAFGISIALWGVFLVMEEVFIAYEFEKVHVMLFVFELLTLLSLHLLPSEKDSVADKSCQQ